MPSYRMVSCKNIIKRYIESHVHYADACFPKNRQ